MLWEWEHHRGHTISDLYFQSFNRDTELPITSGARSISTYKCGCLLLKLREISAFFHSERKCGHRDTLCFANNFPLGTGQYCLMETSGCSPTNEAKQGFLKTSCKMWPEFLPCSLHDSHLGLFDNISQATKSFFSCWLISLGGRRRSVIRLLA